MNEDNTSQLTDAEEWSELIASLDSEIAKLETKIHNGRIRDTDNENIRINYHRQLLKAFEEKRELLKTAPQINRPDSENSGKNIYLVEGDGLYKIGISASPDKRLKSLQNSSPTPLKMIYTSEQTQGAIHIERVIHDEFSHSHSHGEWFELDSKEVGDVIQSIQREISEFSTGQSE